MNMFKIGAVDTKFYNKTDILLCIGKHIAKISTLGRFEQFLVAIVQILYMNLGLFKP